MIGPVGLATLVAVVVGNYFNHGIYHELIDIASLPFLPDRWPKAMPKALRIYHILSPSDPSPVCLPLDISVANAKALLNRHPYTGFPVVDAESGVVAGIALRHHLEEQLERSLSSSGSEGLLDVGKITDFHCITVRENLPLEVAYNFFKHMELQHLIVVDDNTHPQAVLTRASLLPWKVEEIVCDRTTAGLSNVRSTIARPRSFREGGAHSPIVSQRSLTTTSNRSRPSSGASEVSGISLPTGIV